ncbi:MAG: class I SAM-dependent methyltransferase [Chloroflexota bacterium]
METKTIQSDFDKLALLDADGWDHNRHYHAFLLKQLPPICHEALEIGCGTGVFSRCLSRRAGHILALDLSPEMIRIAEERSLQYTNIDYQVADVLKWDFPEGYFDCIVSIATLHHLPLEYVLQKMKTALKTNGVLILLDLFKAEGISDLARGMVAVPVSAILRLKNTGRLQETEQVRAAWAEHGVHDTYLPISEARRICNGILPEASVKKHLLWRYSLVWHKQA